MSLSLNFVFFDETVSPRARITHNIQPCSKETSLSIWRKGSLTLEAVVVIPLVMGFLITILNFFRVLQVQETMEEALSYVGRRTAVEASVVTDDAALLLSAEALLLANLRDESRIEAYVEGGALGISLLESRVDREYLHLRATYRMDLPVNFFGLGSLRMWNQGQFRKWVGTQLPSEEGEVYVYITPSGEVYHKSADCSSIHVTVREAERDEIGAKRGSDGQKFYACPLCVNEGWQIGNVYYTDYGTLYHAKKECRHLKRTTNRVLLSEVTGRRPCHVCYEENE